jgi:hypothetical protein
LQAASNHLEEPTPGAVVNEKVILPALLRKSPSLVDLETDYLAHNKHTLIPILSQINPIQTFPTYFLLCTLISSFHNNHVYLKRFRALNGFIMNDNIQGFGVINK